VLLDQLKAASPPPPVCPSSPSPPSLTNRSNNTASPALGTRSGSSFALLESSSVDNGHSVKDYRSTIRCGGFA
jgi:hypothetical protein